MMHNITNLDIIKDLLIENKISFISINEYEPKKETNITEKTLVPAIMITMVLYDEIEALLNEAIDIFYIDILDSYFVVY
jgi:hypothetical protein